MEVVANWQTARTLSARRRAIHRCMAIGPRRSPKASTLRLAMRTPPPFPDMVP
jgi:hypothetical protein